MAEVPDHLDALAARAASSIGMPRLPANTTPAAIDQVPAQAVARGSDADIAQTPVVLGGVHVVLHRGGHIEPHARRVDLAGALEAAPSRTTERFARRRSAPGSAFLGDVSPEVMRVVVLVGNQYCWRWIFIRRSRHSHSIWKSRLAARAARGQRDVLDGESSACGRRRAGRSPPGRCRRTACSRSRPAPAASARPSAGAGSAWRSPLRVSPRE